MVDCTAWHRVLEPALSIRAMLLVLALLLAPPAAGAQPATKVPRVGFISAGPVAPRIHLWNAFRHGLRDLGYVEGQNIVFEFRAVEREGDPVDSLAAELVRLKVDVIVAATDAVVQAAQRATRTIPIVMISGQDPEGRGLVRSLARPGGNVTGLSIVSLELSQKRVELLREIAPKIRRVAILWNPSSDGRQFQQVEAAARTLQLQVLSLEARTTEDVEKAFATAARDHVGGLIVVGALAFGLRAQIAALAIRHRLPAVGPASEVAKAGLLLTYAPSIAEGYRGAATYVDIDISKHAGRVNGESIVVEQLAARSSAHLLGWTTARIPRYALGGERRS